MGINLSLMAQAYNLDIQEVEAGGSEAQGHPQLHVEFEINLM